MSQSRSQNRGSHRSSKSKQSRWNWVSSKSINKNEVDISHFRILDIIGAGGFSKVFLAQNRITKEKVAIKVVDKLRAVNSASFRKTLWVERDVMSKFNSPFLLNVQHVFQSERECYFVLPYMEGSDLTHYSRSHFFLDEQELKIYIAQLLLALEELHDNDIIHRDIKPRNMLLDGEGNMKLCDFGLSHQLKHAKDSTDGVAGTEAYCAPEMVLGKKYGKSVDVWSYGVTIFELICKRRPFKSDVHMKQCFSPGSGAGIDFQKGHPISKIARDLVLKLLTWDAEKRLGCGPQGPREIRQHPFFHDVDFDQIERLTMVPPYRPKDDTTPTKKVDDHVFEEKAMQARALTSWEQDYFKNIEFNTSSPNYVSRISREDVQHAKGNDYHHVAQSKNKTRSHRGSHVNSRGSDEMNNRGGLKHLRQKLRALTSI